MQVLLPNKPIVRRTWSEFDLRHINLNCKIVEFLADTIIIGDTDIVPEHFHFIVSGTCKIVRVGQMYVLVSVHKSYTLCCRFAWFESILCSLSRWQNFFLTSI